MSTPTQRPPVRSSVLLAGVLAAVLTAALWLYLARLDGVPDYVDVAAGQSGTAAGGTWRLRGLERADSVPNPWGVDEPVTGATFVVATLDADLRAADPDASCTFALIAGQLTITQDSMVGDEVPGAVCARHGTEPVSVVFEVPEKALGDIEAVTVAAGTGARLRLAGTLG